MYSILSKKVVIAGVILLLLFVGGIVIFVMTHTQSDLVQEEEVVTPVPEAKPAVAHAVAGTSVEGRSIDMYTYGTGDTHLLFVGGIHGGYEWNSVLLAYQFMDYLEANPTAIPNTLSVTVIPSANPDGVYAVIGKEGRFTLADAPATTDQTGLGRFNANEVDLNRNFDCKWAPLSSWRSKIVSAGTSAFSEPEAVAIKTAVEQIDPKAVVFWHSQSNTVYASECTAGILPQTLNIMNAYATAAGYLTVEKFDAYPITGDAEGWLASIDIPAITVELKTHETVEWDKNLLGITALFNYFK